MIRLTFISVALVLIFEYFCINTTLAQGKFKPPMPVPLDPKKTADIEQIQKETVRLIKETELLNAEKAHLTDQIAQISLACSTEITDLQKQQRGTEEKLDENKKKLVELLRKIQEEETVHVRLEAELKVLFEVLHLHEYQYKIVRGDLRLMEKRRNNGTTDKCNEVTLSLAGESDEVLLTRAHLSNPNRARKPKISEQDMQLRILNAELDIKKLLKMKSQLSVDKSKTALNSVLELCEEKKKNIYQLLRETDAALVTSNEDVAVLQKDFLELTSFSESIRLEIKTGKSFLQQFREDIQKMKNKINNYRDDLHCFNNVKSMN